MSAVREPESLVKALADERVPPEEPDVLAARRERLVPLIGLQIREASAQRERRAHRVRVAGIAAAAASFVLAAGIGYRMHRGAKPQAVARANVARVASVREVTGTLVVTHAGRARVVSQAELPELAGGDELRTAADGHALLQTERSSINVEPATQVSLLARDALEERIHLSVGRVELKVTKQPQSTRSVVVETPNAEVVVHGTMFSVAVGSEQNVPVTRVRVTEGSVWILHNGKRELISVGSAWASNGSHARTSPSEQSAPELPAATPAASTPPAVLGRGNSTRSVAPAAAPASRAASGSLGEENRMFQAAIDARNRGEEGRALELFAALLARYPNGHLAEEARVERMRALRRTGNATGAASEARRYLAEHPHGYAQDEARGDALGK
ncbi:MAG: FecR domain-containing protein [Myxococcota bacterium]